MYENLKKLGLEKYLNKLFGFQEYHKELWLEKVDIFVGNLLEDNFSVLSQKIINRPLEHMQINDIAHEIMIACAYHPKADFIKEGPVSTPDLYSKDEDIYIEVKTLNVGKDEIDRYEFMEKNNNIFSPPATTFDNKEIEKMGVMKNRVRNCLTKKCNDHFNKALSQLCGKGIVYLVYDYNLFYNLKYLHLLSQKDVLGIIDSCKKQFHVSYPMIAINIIYFGDLRETIIRT